MAILLEGTTVVVAVGAINARFPGGHPAFERASPNSTYRSDGTIAGISFMVLADAWTFVRALTRHGLIDPSTAPSSDVAVIDQAAGFLAPCDWLTIDLTTFELPDRGVVSAAIAWAGETRPASFSAPPGWTPRVMQPVSEAELETAYELVKVERRPQSGGAVATYRHRQTGERLYIARPQIEGQTPHEGFAALQQMLATVMSAPISRTRADKIDELRARAAALVEETRGAERGPLMIQGIAARLARRWADAERTFRKVTELWPNHLDGWLELTWALASLDRPEEALAAAERGAAVNPESPAALGNVASALLQNGRANEALPIIDRALQLDPTNQLNQRLREHITEAAATPEPAPEPAPSRPWYKRWLG